ncbi:MAG TPA: hypothetical protein VN931_06345 [Fibrobacteria bacterium]|nr:hypothetical protein [Fibrobacteria bacterium]
MDAATELVECYARLELAYQPFSEDGRKWKGDPAGLDEIVRLRAQALQKGAVLLDRIREVWSQWESREPGADERARVFAARNRIVELGLAVARADVALQGKARRRTEELRQLAAEAGRKHKAARAYRQGKKRFA